MNGYVTSRYLKFFNMTDLIYTALVCAVALPLHILGALLIEQIFAWYAGHPSTHSFGNTMLRAFGIYLLHATMCYIGALLGYSQKATPRVVPIGKVVRPIPTQPWYMSVYVLAPVFGLVQFGVIFIEFNYLMQAILEAHIYSMFGYLLLNMLILVAVISLLSCISTYL